ncbi:methyltransferase domain-containing protein [Flavobacteriaceae bacterium]|nr:methyltransferase domain-containing protein [Flavobacteriaceae bacterium]MDC0408736.1 methyltransferase domain-containing protein [Flavobacteriaceae bacterium]
MRLHRNLVFATIDSLHGIFNEQKAADKVLRGTLKRDKRWGSRDRSFIAETTYDIVRWKRLYQEIAEVKEPFDRDNLFRLFVVWATLRGIKLPDWPQFEGVPTRKIKGRFDTLSKVRVLRESIPDWLDEVGLEAFGKEQWSAELKALNQQAKVVLRCNTLKGTRKDLASSLAANGIETEAAKQTPEGLVLKQRDNVFTTEEFQAGLFEVQDLNSQRVGHWVKPKPGMRVIDACAGAGGKSLHMAALMENKGQIIALDIFPKKLEELKRRARRSGAHNIETRLIESRKTIKKLYQKADAVLIDAPCTGIGVLKRNPDAKWKLTPEFLTEITQVQKEILNDYSSMVKPGGTLVYATCSILPQENQLQIEAFLKSENGEDFSLEAQESLLPSVTGYDGFFMARLKRK